MLLARQAVAVPARGCGRWCAVPEATQSTGRARDPERLRLVLSMRAQGWTVREIEAEVGIGRKMVRAAIQGVTGRSTPVYDPRLPS